MAEFKRGVAPKHVPLWLTVFALIYLAAACGPAQATPTPNPFGFLSEPVKCDNLSDPDWSPEVASLKDNFFNNFSTKKGRIVWDCTEVKVVLDQFDAADDALVEEFGVDPVDVAEATKRIERIVIVDSGTSRVDRSRNTVELDKKGLGSADHEKMHTVLGRAYRTDEDGTTYYYAEYTEGIAENPTLALDPRHPNSAYRCRNGPVVNYHRASQGVGMLKTQYPDIFRQSAALTRATPLGFPIEALAQELSKTHAQDASQVLQNIYTALPPLCEEK